MVDFGSGQGRSSLETAGVAGLRRGFQSCENAGRGRKMPFWVGHKKNPRTGRFASPGIYRLHQDFHQMVCGRSSDSCIALLTWPSRGVSSMLPNSPVAFAGFRPHSQRRVRAGIAPASLFRVPSITSGRSPSPAGGTVYRFSNSGRSSTGRRRCQRGSLTRSEE